MVRKPELGIRDDFLAGDVLRWKVSVDLSSLLLWLGWYLRRFEAIPSHPSFAALSRERLESY